jgi:hypothetical protein
MPASTQPNAHLQDGNRDIERRGRPLWGGTYLGTPIFHVALRPLIAGVLLLFCPLFVWYMTVIVVSSRFSLTDWGMWYWDYGYRGEPTVIQRLAFVITMILMDIGWVITGAALRPRHSARLGASLAILLYAVLFLVEMLVFFWRGATDIVVASLSDPLTAFEWLTAIPLHFVVAPLIDPYQIIVGRLLRGFYPDFNVGVR